MELLLKLVEQCKELVCEDEKFFNANDVLSRKVSDIRKTLKQLQDRAGE